MVNSLGSGTWLARFIHQNRDFKKSSSDRPARANWTAFYDKRPGDLSVDAHRILGRDINWQVGYDIKIERKAHHYYGAADISFDRVANLNLKVVSKPVYFPFKHLNHAEIIGVPAEAKEDRIQMAKDLACASSFFYVPDEFVPKGPGFCYLISKLLRLFVRNSV